MKIANNAEPNAPKYESPIWTRYATHEDPHPKVSERTLRDETGIDNELVEENILPELGEILKGVFYFFIAFLSVFLVIVLPIHFYLLVPDIQIVSVGQIELAVPSEYKLEMYQGRIPWNSMWEQCEGQKDNRNKEFFGTLTIETECEDLAVDRVVRSNMQSIFKNLKPNQRLMWTGGYFNLRESDHFLWVDPTAKTDYKNFCLNPTMIIENAKTMHEYFLYIVKDYRGEGNACWQIYSQKELSGFDDGRPNQWMDPGPRLSFLCKLATPLGEESETESLM